ncbi:selenocysteine synthase [Neisseria sp. 83E34]|uniref:selenocysteine synthase n=1 Tax=Neisseria sp. 83E34 TaxID=1692264 RepID=UPI0006CE92AB|nr:selenocysteine synthase [Neisseria sp. 83E34]KPN71399.1 selenocysteine synthase [Neisseria sp. 83E34]
MNDPLYFHRPDYAAKLVNSLKDGIMHAFTLFAPRRMGKTKFLLNDIAPAAEEAGFNVFYFSFMDDNRDNLTQRFQAALYHFAQNINKISSAKTFISSVSKIDILGVGIERDTETKAIPPISDIISAIAAVGRPSLLLLDEVQELARIKGTEGIIRALRTGLDINQNQVKTIFTGSSTHDLKAMFNNSRAPFFHFAHALDFPLLSRAFTDFLADIYHERTGNAADKNAFYEIFEKLNHTPMYMRAIVQDMIVNPDLSLHTAAVERLEQLNSQDGQIKEWQQMRPLEQIILADIAQNNNVSPYSNQRRKEYALMLGVTNISSSSVQSALKRMERHNWISRDMSGSLQINSPLLQIWIMAQDKR